MKKLLLLTVLLFALAPHLNAGKNVFVAGGLSLMLPGAGFTYLEEHGSEYDAKSLAYFGVEMALLNWAAYETVTHAGEGSNISIIPLFLFGAVKAVEILDVYIETREHNKRAEGNCSFEPRILNDKLNLSVVYKF